MSGRHTDGTEQLQEDYALLLWQKPSTIPLLPSCTVYRRFCGFLTTPFRRD
jgi:hypothetical protein